MNQPNEAYAYGAYLGNFQRSIKKFKEEVIRGFRFALTAPEKLSEEDYWLRREMLSRRRFKAHIESERRKGRAFVKTCAEDARRDLGL